MPTALSAAAHATGGGLGGLAAAAGAGGGGIGGTIAMPGLIIGGPLAPLAATLTAGVLGGALLGGTAGSLISCREIGVQNETHFMMNEFRKVYHPEGYVVGTVIIAMLKVLKLDFSREWSLFSPLADNVFPICCAK